MRFAGKRLLALTTRKPCPENPTHAMKYLAIAGLTAFACAPLPAQATDKIDVAVLVTGRDDGARRDDFAAFLRLHFARVGTASYSDFTATDAEGYDVVVLDAEVRPQPGRIGLPPMPQLGDDYARATVLVQGAGAIVGDRAERKIDWH